MKRPGAPVKTSHLRTTSLPLGADTRPHYPSQSVRSMLHHNKILFEGDHIAIRGSDGEPYFVVIEGFQVTAEGARLFTFSWLLPKPEFARQILESRSDQFEPFYYRLGPRCNGLASVDAILNVLYSPLSLHSKLKLESTTPVPKQAKDSKTLKDSISFFEEVASAHFLCDFK